VSNSPPSKYLIRPVTPRPRKGKDDIHKLVSRYSSTKIPVLDTAVNSTLPVPPAKTHIRFDPFIFNLLGVSGIASRAPCAIV